MFDYGFRINMNLGKSQLDYNLLSIQQLNQQLKVNKDLYNMGKLSHSLMMKMKRVLSKELKDLYLNRNILLENKRRTQRERYTIRIKEMKITAEYKNKVVNSALSKLSEEERKVLKEYSFKL